MKTLSEFVAAMMVTVHDISPELAAYYVKDMSPVELRRRFRMYIRQRVEARAREWCEQFSGDDA